MRENFVMMQESAGSLAPRVAAELLKINRMLTRMRRPMNKGRNHRIGPTQERILASLRDQSHSQVTLSALAEDTAVSPATASEAVRGLKARGFVRKARSRDDARVVFLSLSAAGRRKAERAAAGSHHLNAAIERLTSREQELALHTLKNIQQAMAPGSER